MSAELISAVSLSPLPVGVLAGGTLYYAPIGAVVVTGALVTCHLCGRLLRSVTAHLRVHGWTKLAYCEAFGLERGQSLEGPETRKLRAAALTSRLVFEPAMREGSAAGRARARAGRRMVAAAKGAGCAIVTPPAGVRGGRVTTAVNGRVNGRSMALVLLENGLGLDLDLDLFTDHHATGNRCVEAASTG
jgi:hypothetical protein